MTISNYSNVIVGRMLGWLKGFANWVLRLFNLAGSARTSPLLWLSRNWLKLLVVLMIVGVAMDVLVWLIRWRPHWVWFHKERVIVEDEKFFAEGKAIEDSARAERRGDSRSWQERDYVVASTVAKRKEPAAERTRYGSGRGRLATRVSAEGMRVSNRRTARHRTEGVFSSDALSYASAGDAPSYRHRPSEGGGRRRDWSGEERPEDAPKDADDLDLFGVDAIQLDASDFYQDSVFNVQNLPTPDGDGGDEDPEDD